MVFEGEDGFLTVGSSILLPILTNAIQEQQMIILQLSGQVQEIAEIAGAESFSDKYLSLNQFAQLVADGEMLQFTGGVEFADNVVFHSPVAFSSDQIGTLTIPANTTKVKVIFSTPFKTAPIVNITPVGIMDGSYTLEEVTEGSFIVSLILPFEMDTTFNWTAFLSDEGQSPTVEVVEGDPVEALLAEYKLLAEASSSSVEIVNENESPVKEILILDSELGYVRVGQEATTDSKEIGQVLPGEVYVFDEIQLSFAEGFGEVDWYHIEYVESEYGWVSGLYVEEFE